LHYTPLLCATLLLMLRRAPAAPLFPYTTLFRSLRHSKPDHASLQPAAQCPRIDYPKPDGKLTFDRLSSVFISNTNHEENQPIHRSEEHTSELQSRENLVCRLLLEKKKRNNSCRQ